jgi:hypothetical protein
VKNIDISKTKIQIKTGRLVLKDNKPNKKKGAVTHTTPSITDTTPLQK